MKKKWVALDKELSKTFSEIRREYSKIEAMYSLSLDANCAKVRSNRAYSRMWSWSVNRVIRFMKKVNLNGTATEQQRNSNETGYSLIILDIHDKPEQQRDGSGTATEHEYKEQEQEQEKTILSGKPNNGIPYKKIIDLLNETADTNFRHTTRATQSHIKARFNEKFTFSDFEAVIKEKTFEWKNDHEMVMYIRPQTLFGNKFESYLQAAKKGQTELVKSRWKK